MSDYLEGLNPEQRGAVQQTEGAVMIIAGAGSGKTRVLTYRIAHLMQKGVDSFNIMALTFTNKAAREMKERIAHIVGNTEAKNLWMGTFHSIFAKILRFEAHRLGYPSNFTIYDTDDSKSLIKAILNEQGLDDKVYKPGMVYNRISSAKNNLISPEQYQADVYIQEEDKSNAKPKMGLIYQIYNERCFRAGAMDFDDLLFKTNILLRDFPEVLHKYQDKFKYILVDEYQDTNYSQYLIVKKLAAKYENICVVGDDAQSIYAFRGANIQNILNFKSDYPEVKVFKLEQNYRSTKNIVGAANSIIANNQDQLEKVVWTANEPGEPIRVYKSLTDNEEGGIVAGNIFETKMNEQAHNKDFAILYRTNSQSRAMEEALRKLNIPYRIYGGLSFYARKEIKDLLAYFNLAINNKNEEALKRVINYPARGIGKTSLERMIVLANENSVSPWDIVANADQFKVQLGAAAAAKMSEFANMIKSFSIMLKAQNAYELSSHIATSSGLLKELYNDRSPEGVSRYENIESLLNSIKEFVDSEDEIDTLEQDLQNLEQGGAVDTGTGELYNNTNRIKTLDEYIKDIALLTDADKDDPADADRVSLMTIHASKGLEFNYVFVVGLEENLFPSHLSLNARADLEEERRLFYVALTRAKKRAVLTYSETRYRWGNLVVAEASRFIEELEEKYVEHAVDKRKQQAPTYLGMNRNPFTQERTEVFQKKEKPQPTVNPVVVPKGNFKKVSAANPVKNTTSDFVADDPALLQTGMDVEHERFGIGKIVNLEGGVNDIKATVFFQGLGQKQLLLRYAKLKIVK
ncbi:MAG: UvrD-helicase domain-containing protein [Sphingobacteriales bacterium JAD_PAG50586_3]|nr:MAG: UvrD-helicase domain-containing protein [Sphingobacteriales bacterium JAD_PAG50586_3]